MFKLVKMLNGRQNVSEPLKMESHTEAATLFKAGQAVTYSAPTLVDGVLSAGNVLTPASGSARAEYIVMDDTATTAAGGRVPLLPITPDMIFEVPLGAVAGTNANAQNRKAGMRVTLYTDSDADVGLKITDTAASARFTTAEESNVNTTTENFGALIVDANGAAAVGDKMLVRLA